MDVSRHWNLTAISTVETKYYTPLGHELRIFDLWKAQFVTGGILSLLLLHATFDFHRTNRPTRLEKGGASLNFPSLPF